MIDTRIRRKVKFDIAGKSFGRLTAISPTDERRYGQTVWICKCSCGKTVYVPRGNLVNGITNSCGCYKKYRKLASSKAYACNKTGMRGVTEAIKTSKEYGKYVAYVARFRGKYLGTFDTTKEAQTCYLDAKERYMEQTGGIF